jgi:AcrR family transcriptional regulator
MSAESLTVGGAAVRGAERRPGRPRSERADQAIIDATLDLFAEHGVAGISVEAVAAKAGVGKATIYRRWPGKEDLLIDALAALKSPIEQPRGENVREDLIAVTEVYVADSADPRRMQQYVLWLCEAEKYPNLRRRYKETVLEPRREVLRDVLRRGVATGELRSDIDIEIATLALTGTVVARGKHADGAPPPGFATRVVDELLAGLAPR